MLWYHFTITYHMEGETYTRGTSYSVSAASRTIAWRKASEYATVLYGRHLMQIELCSISAY